MAGHEERKTDHCPHCGRTLSPWEQVLLSVDRALMCKGCWYRILLDAFDDSPPEDNATPESGDQC
ncbi:MAG TPA: hypothetical protein ENN17_05120 [bacterium]|nr:hypothetical protein [bacterium]